MQKTDLPRVRLLRWAESTCQTLDEGASWALKGRRSPWTRGERMCHDKQRVTVPMASLIKVGANSLQRSRCFFWCSSTPNRKGGYVHLLQDGKVFILPLYLILMKSSSLRVRLDAAHTLGGYEAVTSIMICTSLPRSATQSRRIPWLLHQRGPAMRPFC